ncbi:unnamed protein product [Caenorhabditis bovis]|uniref:Uncharacterized protein n=1 Tax=Caenorhabditis bovis TaxID=2654633 RepID=A0A8S1EW21_9PELO|nr:unnamed protein product [Caenorhabditis bovis]
MNTKFYTFGVLLLIIHISSAQSIPVNDKRVPEVFKYSESLTSAPSIVEFLPLSPIRRFRRDTSSEEIDPATATLPTDVDVQLDSFDHQYYITETYMKDEVALKKYWVQIDQLLEKPNVVGNKSHPLLSNSYRRAVGTKISFKFPFYGHRMSNLTIATGGFIYIGDQTHNWLAATQYIAPLMANFHTNQNNSNIIYADDGEMFVVEWRNVQLKEDTMNKNSFSFQAILHKNGDIVFVYKDIPISISNISEANHPVKLGISDAYLFNHNELSRTGNQPKRVIYEYHRIEVSPIKVRSNTVVVLKAQPTCIQFETCESCSNATLKHFNCQWCHSKRKNGGPFCTDDAGLHRRRQHWAESNCHIKSKSLYCDGKDEDEVYDDNDLKKNIENQPHFRKPDPDIVVPLNGDFKENRVRKSDGGPSVASFLLLVLLLFCVVGWLVYAYYNPHTTSGQLLIKYRPSRWHVPSSHVRYSASVHM